MARPFKGICDRNPLYFQFVETIMRLEGLSICKAFAVIK